MFHSNSRQICHRRSLWFVARCCLGIKYTQFKTIYFHTCPQKSIYFHKMSIYSHTMSIYFNKMFTRSPWYPHFFYVSNARRFIGVSCRKKAREMWMKPGAEVENPGCLGRYRCIHTLWIHTYYSILIIIIYIHIIYVIRWILLNHIDVKIPT
jgi:hypothetical protein